MFKFATIALLGAQAAVLKQKVCNANTNTNTYMI